MTIGFSIFVGWICHIIIIGAACVLNWSHLQPYGLSTQIAVLTCEAIIVSLGIYCRVHLLRQNYLTVILTLVIWLPISLLMLVNNLGNIRAASALLDVQTSTAKRVEWRDPIEIQRDMAQILGCSTVNQRTETPRTLKNGKVVIDVVNNHVKDLACEDSRTRKLSALNSELQDSVHKRDTKQHLTVSTDSLMEAYRVVLQIFGHDWTPKQIRVALDLLLVTVLWLVSTFLPLVIPQKQ